MTTEEQTTQQPVESNNTPAPPNTKVFVGNLSFRTREPGLREAFEAAGTVLGVRVVTQGRRSMGYGFVQFETLEEAKKSVELLHKKPLDDREINVEISTSSNTGLNPVKRRRPRNRKAKAAAAAAPGDQTQESDGTTPAPETEKAPRKRVRRNRRKRVAAARDAAGEENASGEAGAETPEGDAAANGRRKGRARKPRAPREPREPREFSETVLYVSNIPFALDDEGLLEAFKEFEPSSANIIRRVRTNLSKGFGFVEFADPAKQQEALDAKHKSKILEREITVRKAHVRPPPAEDTENTEKTENTEASNTTSESVEAKAEE